MVDRSGLRRLHRGAGSVQPTIPVTTENTKAIAANHRISPTSVPSRDEIIDPILVNIIDLLSVVILAANAAMFIRLRLAAAALNAHPVARYGHWRPF